MSLEASSHYLRLIEHDREVLRLLTEQPAPALASISTVLERANARLETGSQANCTTSFLLPNQGIGVGIWPSPEATRYGL